MNKQIATILHTIAIVLQAANLLTAVVPVEYKPVVAVVLAGAQAAVGWLQHLSNPDGTPATVAYIPK